MTNVVIAYDLKRYLDQLQAAAPDCEFTVATDEAALGKALPEAEVVVGWTPRITECCLQVPGSPLRWIQSLNAGVDVIPLELCKQRGVFVTTASGVHANPISETVFAMMLAFGRGLHTCMQNQQKHTWDGSAQLRDSLREIHGQTIGILGVGTVGAEIARVAKAFSMRVMGLNPTNQPMPDVDDMYSSEQIDLLLPQCDYVVNILPLTEQTRSVMGRERFAAMKRGAFYIGVGRGPTTDTAALMEALDSGRLGGAGIDVIDPEPLPADHKMWSYPNVIITPHFAGSTPHYDDRAVDILVQNLKAYGETGSPVRNLVDYDRAY